LIDRREMIERARDKPGRQKAKRLLSMVSNSLRTIAELETNERDYTNWDEYSRLRLVIDYISGMTDSYALNLYRKLEGMRIV
jgi:dGTPase